MTTISDLLTPRAEVLDARFQGVLQAHKVHDETDHYYLDTAYIQQNKKPLYFGSVRIGRNYVSFHLMAVYIWPEILNGVSDRLKHRMQGKSCFNFTAPDPELLSELSALTNQGFTKYREAGYVG